MVAFHCAAQTLDERLDEEKFLRGLSEYQLADLLDHYITEHPPANEIDAVLYAITVLRMRLNDDSLTPEQHRSAVSQVLETREELIAGHPGDSRHGVWLAEQAADLLFGLYPLEAAGLAAEFGLVSPGHRAQAAEVAARILALANDADLEITEAILNIEGEPGYQEDIAAQLRRRRMIHEERDRRIPFLRGAGEYLDALHNRGDDLSAQSAGYESAADLLIPLIPELDGVARIRAQLYAGLALARLGRSGEARQHLDAVEANDDATPIDRFAARMGGVVAEEVASGPGPALQAMGEVEAAYAGPDSLFFSILVADRKFLLHRAIAESSPPAQRGSILRGAVEEYLSLLERSSASGADPETLRGILYAKLASAIDESMPVEDLPPIALVALAENFARSEETREQGIELFERALAGAGLDPQATAAALFGLARAHYENEDWLEAAKRFDQVARDLPGDPQAERALGLAATLLRDLYRHAPDSPGIAEQYESTIRLIVESRPGHREIEEWRYELGALRFEQGAAEEAAGLLGSVGAESAFAADAKFMLAKIARQAAAGESAGPAEQDRTIAAAREARAALERAAGQSSEDEAADRAGQRRDALARTRIYEAEALLALGRAEEAIALLAEFSGASDVSRAALADALSLRIRAYQLTGRTAEARAEVDEFIRSIPDEIDLVVPEMMASLAADIEELKRQGEVERALERAESDLLPLAEALRSWMARADVDESARAVLLVSIADANRLAGHHLEALEAYEQALAGDPALLPAIFGRAEARFGLTQYEEAMGDYRRIAASRRTVMNDFFWRSELRMLQVLDLVNRNTQQIAPRIGRLRAMDENFGGYQRDFAVLENKHAGR